MSTIYLTPKTRIPKIRDCAQEMKEDKRQMASVSEFNCDSAQSTNIVDSPNTSAFDYSRPLQLHNRNSVEIGKENVLVRRKVTSLAPLTVQNQPSDMSDLMTLLQRVQIKDESVEVSVDPSQTENQDVAPIRAEQRKQSATCRFIPLRRGNQPYSKNEEYQLLNQEEPANSLCQESRKGQDFIDETQMSLKDVYKMHVLGLDCHQKIHDDVQVFQRKNILKFDSQPENIVQQYQQPLRVLEPSNPLLGTYDKILKQRFRNSEEETSPCTRKISKIPFKVLDAPSLQDDFYLNLIDWSSQNVLAVALAQCVYLWSAQNNKVVKFCDFGSTDDMVCSLVWSPSGHQLAVGTASGEIHMFDANRMKRVGVIEGHQARVGSLAWSNNALCSGSKDKSIHLHDLRVQRVIGKMEGHKQEICGLKWSPDEYQLASGGNDNKLFVWRLGSERPLAKFSQHQAAVKALAWSPHRHGLLASGGGTADRTIRFFNTQTTQELDWIDTGSQVCNLLFSKNMNELISTHGYSMNQIVCWKYPSLEKVVTLTGHTSRVLFLAMSPDGETVVTGAGDETLRFWNIFPKKEEEIPQRSPLVSSTLNLR